MSDEAEEWRPVVGWEGLYEVSSLGRVRSLPRTVPRTPQGPYTVRGRLLKLQRNSFTGYLQIVLSRGGKGRQKNAVVHVLVCTAFKGLRPTPLHEVGHKDGVKSNCRATNVSWVTPKENGADRIRLGELVVGENHPNSIITADTVRAIRSMRGQTQASIGSALGLKAHHVGKILRGELWRHVAEEDDK